MRAGSSPPFQNACEMPRGLRTRSPGPGATRISEVARRAGVQRVTVYNHFPDEEHLLAACSAHWRALHPTPDLAGWRSIEDPGRRIRLGLRQLYAWYREPSR